MTLERTLKDGEEFADENGLKGTLGRGRCVSYGLEKTRALGIKLNSSIWLDSESCVQWAIRTQWAHDLSTTKL